jgi:hypothetical protein
LQLRVVECKVYHNVLMNVKSQIDFDCLLQLHMLDNTEAEQDLQSGVLECKVYHSVLMITKSQVE